MSANQPTSIGFDNLALSKAIIQALSDNGYQNPSPIQAQTIPYLLAGQDVLGQAQTGTGKTAAFALPTLSRIAIKKVKPQVLVLAPTRELAIQVSESFQKYAAHIKGLRVLPIYGGQDYRGQLRALKQGVHIIVGTPGRIIDHVKRETLDLSTLDCLILDEADEMLRMGFIDDVEWILKKSPDDRQVALFSATMPKEIQQIAKRYLKDPAEVRIKQKTATAHTIRQRFWPVNGSNKLDALTRILEAENIDAMLIFVRTKTQTTELSEKLTTQGYHCLPLNGDIPQHMRERTIEQLKSGKTDIIIATDVAARGLDVDRISHVINYDIPFDTEAYIHRIGRTGRAGRTGDAILFVASREKNMLRSIERATKQKIDLMEMPSTKIINDNRVSRFKQRITDTIEKGNLSFFTQLMEQYQSENDLPWEKIAASLASMLQGDTPLLISQAPKKEKFKEKITARSSRKHHHDMEQYRIEVGKKHGVRAGNIVGAIANEAGLDSQFIGQIKILDNFSLISLPRGMTNHTFRTLKKTRVSGKQMRISKVKSRSQ